MSTYEVERIKWIGPNLASNAGHRANLACEILKRIKDDPQPKASEIWDAIHHAAQATSDLERLRAWCMAKLKESKD